MKKKYDYLDIQKPKMSPKQQTINFILDFSKAYYTNKKSRFNFETILN